MTEKWSSCMFYIIFFFFSFLEQIDVCDCSEMQATNIIMPGLSLPTEKKRHSCKGMISCGALGVMKLWEMAGAVYYESQYSREILKYSSPPHQLSPVVTWLHSWQSKAAGQSVGGNRVHATFTRWATPTFNLTDSLSRKSPTQSTVGRYHQSVISNK